MYKLLLVDDERIIREGIANLIDWASNDIEFIGTAKNGVEAYEIILKENPHIVITDIRMPLMDGLELIEKVKKINENIIFIILSGYGEFDYAKKAMQQGVKHYILKPCNENKIIEVLDEIKDEIDEKYNKDELISSSKRNLDIVMPLAKEEFLRNYSMNRNYPIGEIKYYKNLLGINDEFLRIIILKPEGECGYEEKFTIIDISNEEIGKDNVLLGTIIGNHVLLLIKDIEFDRLIKLLNSIKINFKNYYEVNMSAGISDVGSFDDIPTMYKKAQLSVKEIPEKAAQEDYKVIVEKQSKLVNTIKKYVNENIENSELSLKWLASKYIFMNVGYLSKVFNKKTGEKFAHYLMRVRMERAMELIEKSDEDKVYEVAEKVGLGDNPQYFSQLFKKFTGYSPSEYKKK